MSLTKDVIGTVSSLKTLTHKNWPDMTKKHYFWPIQHKIKYWLHHRLINVGFKNVSFCVA